MNQEEMRDLLEKRIEELKLLKNKIGVTYSRSSEIVLDWIDGIILVTEQMLSKVQ